VTLTPETAAPLPEAQAAYQLAEQVVRLPQETAVPLTAEVPATAATVAAQAQVAQVVMHLARMAEPLVLQVPTAALPGLQRVAMQLVAQQLAQAELAAMADL
jgi:hypothetical protein